MYSFITARPDTHVSSSTHVGIFVGVGVGTVCMVAIAVGVLLFYLKSTRQRNCECTIQNNKYKSWLSTY